MKPCVFLLLPAFLACTVLPFAAAAQPAPGGCQYVELASSAIRYTGPSLSPTIQASINDKPATMLLDTGAFATFLTKDGARRHKLKLYSSDYEVTGTSGTSDLSLAEIERFSVGAASPESATMAVLDHLAFQPSWDGLVGAGFLFQADLEINLAAKQVKFFRPIGCKGAHLAYWDPDAVVVPMGYLSEEGATPYFTIEINGKKLRAIIDSGASVSGMRLGVARSAGIDMASKDVRAAGYAVGVGKERVKRWIARVGSVRIGDQVIRDTELDVVDEKSAGSIDVLLGEDFLRAHRVLFAMSQRKIYLTYMGGNPFTPGGAVEPWLLREAEGGNADAQYKLARRYLTGSGGAAQDKETARSWLARAAALGHPQAGVDLAFDMLRARRYTDAASKLRDVLATSPGDTDAALGLYLARLGSGEREQAHGELARFAVPAGDKAGDGWPQPLFDHYLGRIGAPELLAKAALHKREDARRVCSARKYAVMRLETLGDSAAAAAIRDAACDEDRI